MQMEDYPLNLQGRNWIIAGIYVSRCSVDPNNVEEVFQDPKAGQEALDKIFEMCFPERAALKGIVFWRELQFNKNWQEVTNFVNI